MPADLIAELDRLHHRATDLRAREIQLANAGENDPASDTWKTAAIVAASAEGEFYAALVEAWPAIIRAFQAKEKALALAGATLMKLDQTNAELQARVLREAAEGTPRGWVLVPVKPTFGLDAMSGAGAEHIPTEVGRGAAGLMACDIYRAMVARRPDFPSSDPSTDLTADFAQSLPGGELDDSTYSKIEDALDRISAPMTADDGRWLSLHERIDALQTPSTEPSPPASAPAEVSRG